MKQATIRTLLMLILLLAVAVSACADTPQIRLHQIDAGAMAAYMLTADDTAILIDCGTNTNIEKENTALFAYLEKAGLKTITAHIVTHYHDDHAYNILKLSGLYGTDDTVVYGPSQTLPQRYQDLPKGTYHQAAVGDEWNIGPFHFLCVGPEKIGSRGEINSDSLNLVVSCGDVRIFVTGDHVSGRVSKLHGDEIRDMDVLCFPHHGLQPWQISEVALKMVNPRIMLVPGGPEGPAHAYAWRCYMDVPAYGIGSGNVVVTWVEGEMEVHTFCIPGEYPAVVDQGGIV